MGNPPPPLPPRPPPTHPPTNPPVQVLALFNKAVRKLCNCLTEVAEKAVEEEMETISSKKKRLDTIK